LKINNLTNQHFIIKDKKNEKIKNKISNLLVYKSVNGNKTLDKVECSLWDSIILKKYYHKTLKNVINSTLKDKLNVKSKPDNITHSTIRSFNFETKYPRSSKKLLIRIKKLIQIFLHIHVLLILYSMKNLEH